MLSRVVLKWPRIVALTVLDKPESFDIDINLSIHFDYTINANSLRISEAEL